MHLGGGAGAFAAGHTGGAMGGSHIDRPHVSGGLHQRHAFGRRHWGSDYDYGYYNSCLDYPPYYRRNPLDCNYW
jgi:hypothetical protein